MRRGGGEEGEQEVNGEAWTRRRDETRGEAKREERRYAHLHHLVVEAKVVIGAEGAQLDLELAAEVVQQDHAPLLDERDLTKQLALHLEVVGGVTNRSGRWRSMAASQGGCRLKTAEFELQGRPALTCTICPGTKTCGWRRLSSLSRAMSVSELRKGARAMRRRCAVMARRVAREGGRSCSRWRSEKDCEEV